MQLVIPMSGRGERFREAGYSLPKPMIPVNGIPVIERLLRRFPPDLSTCFILSTDDEHSPLPELLKKLRPMSKLLFIPPHKEGPGRALLAALSELSGSDDVLVSYCDYDMEFSFADFETYINKNKPSACLISYRGFHPHYLHSQTYAYARLEGSRVKEIREKGSFTADREAEFASCGAYYFDSVETLRFSLDAQVKRKLLVNGELYTSLTIEALLQERPEAKVMVYEIPYFIQLGTPRDLEDYAYWERTFTAPLLRPKVEQILIPMAGFGSRFKGLHPLPKPLIPVNGEPMVKKATATLPVGDTTWVTLKTIEEKVAKVAGESVHLIALDSTPEGQALTVTEGLAHLRRDAEVFISSCDHGIVLDQKSWDEFRNDSSVDAAIFTVRNYPGTRRRPEAFAYVDAESSYSPVKSVSVKKPLSSQPFQDAVLVGSFWVKSPAILEKYIHELVRRKMMVNNEYYLDSVFNLLIEDGLKVMNIPLRGFINWGDPEGLAEALYWEDYFTKKDGHKRKKFSW